MVFTVAARTHISKGSKTGSRTGQGELTSICKIFPGSIHIVNHRIPSQETICAYFSGNAHDFCGKRTKLVYHGVNSLLELQDLSSHVHADKAMMTVGFVEVLYRQWSNARAKTYVIFRDKSPRATAVVTA